MTEETAVTQVSHEKDSHTEHQLLADFFKTALGGSQSLNLEELEKV